jgi:NAD(P)-dependent dehydrogenase (short-subunit alcohol dehydrogenase family)
VQFSKSVAVQYGPRVIRCNAVPPGLVLTPAVEGMTPQQVEASRRIYPMPRLCEPEDVANAVLYLASDDAGFVNGTTLMVDGGASIYVPSARGEPSRAD